MESTVAGSSALVAVRKSSAGSVIPAKPQMHLSSGIRKPLNSLVSHSPNDKCICQLGSFRKKRPADGLWRIVPGIAAHPRKGKTTNAFVVRGP